MWSKPEQFNLTRIKPIVLFGNGSLYSRSKELTPEELVEAKSIADSLFITCESYKKDMGSNCYGLAAIQIGIPKRIFMIYNDDHILCIANPEAETFGEIIETTEGCMSLPGVVVKIKRYADVKLKGFDVVAQKEIDIELKDLEAQVVQHEMDHLNGQLIDRYMGGVTREMYKRQVAKQTKKHKCNSGCKH